MAPRADLPPSIRDQIVTSTLDKLQASGEFGAQSLERLRELARSGALRRTPRVVEALKLADQSAEATADEAS